ncbi:MAG: PH domain-containing protein [Anaerolineae bacterium]|nr:PH domain-containing protein [Anaerolineae bacterium]
MVIVATVIALTGAAAQAERSLFFATVSVGLAAFFTALFALSPNGVEVGDEVVYIRRRWGGIPRHLDALTAARRIAIHELEYSIRLVSVGGVFGWYGTFQSPKLGEFKMFATRLDRLVLLEFHGERIVVSVDEPDALLALLQVQR